MNLHQIYGNICSFQHFRIADKGSWTRTSISPTSQLRNLRLLEAKVTCIDWKLGLLHHMEQ